MTEAPLAAKLSRAIVSSTALSTEIWSTGSLVKVAALPRTAVLKLGDDASPLVRPLIIWVTRINTSRVMVGATVVSCERGRDVVSIDGGEEDEVLGASIIGVDVAGIDGADEGGVFG